MSSGQRLPLGAAAAVIAVSVALAGCGSSSAAGGNPASGSAGSSSGSYELMYMSDLTNTNGAETPWEQAFQGAVNAANARGGIHGHKINLVICDAQQSENAAAACAQKAVADHAIAMTGLNGEQSEFSYLQAAHIPDINLGGTEVSWKSPVSFMITELSLSTGAGYPIVMKQKGCTSFDVVDTGDAASPGMASAYNTQLEIGAKLAGIKFLGQIVAPLTAADMSTYVQQALSKHPDCVGTQSVGAQEISELQALLPAKNVKVFFGQSYLGTPAEAAAADPILNQMADRVTIVGALADPYAADTDSLVKQWAQDQTTYGPKTVNLETISGSQWAELRLFVQAADAIYPNVTGASMISYLNKLHDFNPGIMPPVSFDQPVPNPYGPRMFAAWNVPAKWDGGKEYPVTGPFNNLLTGKTAALVP
jgi:hypothetical protein